MTVSPSLRFPIGPALAARFGLDDSDLLPPVLTRSGDPVMDRQLCAHPLDAPRVEAAAIAQAQRLFERLPDLDGISLILWSWRLFPFSESDASEDPQAFFIIEPLASPRAGKLGFGPLFKPRDDASERRDLFPIRDPALFSQLGLREAFPDGSFGKPMSRDQFVALVREELGVWGHPLCARHLLAAGWGPLCRMQSVSSGWSAGRFKLLPPEPAIALKKLYPAGASLAEAIELRSGLPAAATAGPRPAL